MIERKGGRYPFIRLSVYPFIRLSVYPFIIHTHVLVARESWRRVVEHKPAVSFGFGFGFEFGSWRSQRSNSNPQGGRQSRRPNAPSIEIEPWVGRLVAGCEAAGIR